MEAFKFLDGLVAPLDQANVDTDAIIPKQFLKSIKRSGFGPYLFDEWRYMDRGEPEMDCTNRPKNPNFILNKEGYQNSSILLVRENFGCGSSREHAPWALLDYGFRCIIAPSFADIFYNNCFKNGILPVVLSPATVDQLFKESKGLPDYRLQVDLQEQKVTTPVKSDFHFDIDPFRKHCLLEGLDDIGLTLEEADKIRAYEERRRQETPWLFP
jgi:3-isopropylmalate/(R)-2-methylmalate dehydratase small subunit